MVVGLLFSSLFIDIGTWILMGGLVAWYGVFDAPSRRRYGRGWMRRAMRNGSSLLRAKIVAKRLKDGKSEFQKVSVIIPLYNEEKIIEKAIRSAFNQSRPPERVIVIDDCSTDKSLEVCYGLQKEFPNLKVISRGVNRGKANNVGYVLAHEKLSELTLVLDSDTFLSPKYIERVSRPFIDPNVVITTGMSFPVRQPGFWGNIIYFGTLFQYKLFSFRKHAQGFRSAISVITGDSAIYRTAFLKGVGGLPEGTQTEDMDVTWLAAEMGYRVAYASDALALSMDAGTFKGHWSQITRWFAGAFQCLVKHGSRVLKAKSMFWTTIMPVYFDAMLYSMMYIIAPFLLLFFSGWYYYLVIGFYIADLLFTIIVMSFVGWSGVLRLPQIYVLKYVWALAWWQAFLKTMWQFANGKREWSSRWSRENFQV